MNIIGICVIFLASNTWLGAIFVLSNPNSLTTTALINTARNSKTLII